PTTGSFAPWTNSRRAVAFCGLLASRPSKTTGFFAWLTKRAASLIAQQSAGPAAEYLGPRSTSHWDGPIMMSLGRLTNAARGLPDSAARKPPWPRGVRYQRLIDQGYRIFGAGYRHLAFLFLCRQVARERQRKYQCDVRNSNH